MDYKEYIYDKFIFKVKNGIYYHKDGCWVEVDGNIATIGVSDFFQILNGDVASVSLYGIEVNIVQDDPLGDIETMKTSIELISPVNGEIIEHNKQVADSAELINSDPYGEGWLLKAELKNFDSDKLNLMDSGKYFDYMKARVDEEGKELGKEQ
ncbi:MAG: glycine cleavage system protein H [Actinobacteria bacterium]|nr:glycine cleavage system protein H [Actinomycetota bacterium]